MEIDSRTVREHSGLCFGISISVSCKPVTNGQTNVGFIVAIIHFIKSPADPKKSRKPEVDCSKESHDNFQEYYLSLSRIALMISTSASTIIKNTGLAVPAALAQRLQRCTARKIQNGR